MAYSLRRRAKARNVTIGDFHSALLPISFPEFSIPLSSETANERVSSLSFPVPLDKFIEDSGNEICSTSPTTRCSSPLESLKTLPWRWNLRLLPRFIQVSPFLQVLEQSRKLKISRKRHTSTSQHSSVGNSLLRSFVVVTYGCEVTRVLYRQNRTFNGFETFDLKRIKQHWRKHFITFFQMIKSDDIILKYLNS